MYRPIFIVRSKTIPLVFISLVIFMMITSGSFHFVLADPLHCDIEGWPSCYSVGYSHGLANPGTSCPSGHSDNYCAGWEAGARTENIQATQGPQPTLPAGCGYGYDNSTCTNPNPQTTTPPQGCGYGYDNSTCGSQETGLIIPPYAKPNNS